MQNTIRVRFTKNVCYKGTDYGPSYEPIADLPEGWARKFEAQGAAMIVPLADFAPKPVKAKASESSPEPVTAAEPIEPEAPARAPKRRTRKRST